MTNLLDIFLEATINFNDYCSVDRRRCNVESSF